MLGVQFLLDCLKLLQGGLELLKSARKHFVTSRFLTRGLVEPAHALNQRETLANKAIRIHSNLLIPQQNKVSGNFAGWARGSKSCSHPPFHHGKGRRGRAKTLSYSKSVVARCLPQTAMLFSIYQQTQHWLKVGVFEAMVHELRSLL